MAKFLNIIPKSPRPNQAMNFIFEASGVIMPKSPPKAKSRARAAKTGHSPFRTEKRKQADSLAFFLV
jgi:hypothetical protein